MGRTAVWVAAVAGVVGGVLGGIFFGRTAGRESTAPAASLVTDSANPCAVDPSGHATRLVTVEPGVSLEVLDWGGTGEPIVLLTGSGDNAHVFDDFAYQLNDRFRVIGITRRGFGRSSQPDGGYDLPTRARDDITVLDSLGIPAAIFIGHSVAGTEMNELGATHPNRVRKLVYLDAMDLGAGGWASLPQPPYPPEWSAEDLASIHRAAAADARDAGFRKPLAALCSMVRLDSTGRIAGEVTPGAVAGKLTAGLHPAAYDRITVPVLGILNRISPRYRLPYYDRLDPVQQAAFAARMAPLAQWIDGAIERFRSGIKGAKVIEMHDGNHYMFITDEGMVVREIRSFLLADSVPATR